MKRGAFKPGQTWMFKQTFRDAVILVTLLRLGDTEYDQPHEQTWLCLDHHDEDVGEVCLNTKSWELLA